MTNLSSSYSTEGRRARYAREIRILGTLAGAVALGTFAYLLMALLMLF